MQSAGVYALAPDTMPVVIEMWDNVGAKVLEGAIRRGDVQELYLCAEREAREGLLERAVELYEYILKRFPDQALKARIALAEISFGRGYFGEAEGYLKDISTDRVLQEDIKRYDAVKEKVDTALGVQAERERLGKLGYRTFARPDGKGGCVADTFGFKGKWSVANRTASQNLNPGFILRICKSIARMVEDSASAKIIINNSDNEIVVLPDSEFEAGLPVSISVFSNNEGYRILVAESFLSLELEDQRAVLGQVLEGRIPAASAKRQDSAMLPNVSKHSPIAMVSLDRSSLEGVSLLSSILEDEEYKVKRYSVFGGADEMSSMEMWNQAIRLNEYERNVEKICDEICSSGIKVVCVSVSSISVEKAYLFMKKIRERRPDIFIIAGGPMSDTPEQMLSLLPEIDCFIEGEADVVLPEMLDLLTDGYAHSISEIKDLAAGGVYLRNGNNYLVTDMHRKNIAHRFHLPPYKIVGYIFASRGCPYKCRFCSNIMGRNVRYADMSEIENWLLSALAKGLEQGSKNAIGKQTIKQLLHSGVSLFDCGLDSPINVRIVDENFLINQIRIVEFYGMLERTGMRPYFRFYVGNGSIRAVTKSGRINRKYFELLKNMGVMFYDFGVDGFSERLLREFDKGYNLEEVVEFLFEFSEVSPVLMSYNRIASSLGSYFSDTVESLILGRLLGQELPSVNTVNMQVFAQQGNEITSCESITSSHSILWHQNTESLPIAQQGVYFVPPAGEYSFRILTPISPYDALLAKKMAETGQQSEFLKRNKDMLWRVFPIVVRRWASGKYGKELQALARVFPDIVKQYDWDIEKAISKIRKDMAAFACIRFTEIEEIYKKYGNNSGELEIRSCEQEGIENLHRKMVQSIKDKEWGRAFICSRRLVSISNDKEFYFYIMLALAYKQMNRYDLAGYLQGEYGVFDVQLLRLYGLNKISYSNIASTYIMLNLGGVRHSRKRIERMLDNENIKDEGRRVLIFKMLDDIFEKFKGAQRYIEDLEAKSCFEVASSGERVLAEAM